MIFLVRPMKDFQYWSHKHRTATGKNNIKIFCQSFKNLQRERKGEEKDTIEVISVMT